MKEISNKFYQKALSINFLGDFCRHSILKNACPSLPFDATRNSFYTYRKSAIKPPGGGYLFQAIWEGGLIETRGLFEKGGLFNLEKTMVSVLHKKLNYKVEKLMYKKVGGHAAGDQNQIRTSR